MRHSLFPVVKHLKPNDLIARMFGLGGIISVSGVDAPDISDQNPGNCGPISDMTGDGITDIVCVDPDTVTVTPDSDGNEIYRGDVHIYDGAAG